MAASVKNSFLERLPAHVDDEHRPYATPKLARSSLRLLLLTLFYLVFLVLGASIFSAIESPGELGLIKSLAATKRDFVSNHYCLSEEELEELLEEVLLAHDRGVSATRNASSGRNWSFGQSFFFSGTIVTTIGYGHVAPLSEGGKLFCVIYGLIGIPLTLVLLSAYVERLHRPTTSLLRLVHERFNHLYQPFHIRIIHLAAVGGIIFLVFFVIPALIFKRIEPTWTFLDGLYYCFISLTTIGLGDYIPGDSPDQEYRTLYKVLVTAYLIVGLTFMMLLLSVFAEIPQLNFGLWFLIKSEEAGAALPFTSYSAAASDSASGIPSKQQQDPRNASSTRTADPKADTEMTRLTGGKASAQPHQSFGGTSDAAATAESLDLRLTKLAKPADGQAQQAGVSTNSVQPHATTTTTTKPRNISSNPFLNDQQNSFRDALQAASPATQQQQQQAGRVTQNIRVKARPLDSPSPDDYDLK